MAKIQIVHLSDIHIRFGSRHDEYRTVLTEDRSPKSKYIVVENDNTFMIIDETSQRVMADKLTLKVAATGLAKLLNRNAKITDESFRNILKYEGVYAQQKRSAKLYESTNQSEYKKTLEIMVKAKTAIEKIVSKI